MVAMASDSYLLKVPQPSCQGCQNCRNIPVRSTSCGVVVSLVLLLGAVLGLAALSYHLRLELCSVRGEVQILDTKVKTVESTLKGLIHITQMKVFEAEPNVSSSSSTSSFYDDDEEDEDDDTSLAYVDTEAGMPVENKVRDTTNTVQDVPRLDPAGSLQQPTHSAESEEVRVALKPFIDGGDGNNPKQGEVMELRGEEMAEEHEDENSGHRVRRQAAAPQLKLYHMLQTPGQAIAPPPVPAEPWRYYDSHRDGRSQAMYAEHAPLSFVTSPRASYATTAAPIASRRSRVMDSAASQQRYHQRQRTGRQRTGEGQLEDLQQLQQLQQNIGARSVEVGRQVQHQPRRYYQAYDQREHRERAPWRGAGMPTDGARRRARSIDTTVEVEQTWRPYAPSLVEGPAIAAHFVGDSSRHRNTHHYDENGRLKHPSGEFADWRPSPWMRELGLDNHFQLAESGGHVTVNTQGLYLVYAQVNYANDKDENGFWVYRNGHKELLCAVTSNVSNQPDARANTCFTAGVLHLSRGDRVWLKDLTGDRYRVLDHPGRSFIGMVNLSSCKSKTEQPSKITV